MPAKKTRSSQRLTGADSDFLKIVLPACRSGRLADVKTFCRDPRGFTNWIGPHGRTMLWEAARGGRLDVVEFLDHEHSANCRAIGCYFRETRVELSPWSTAMVFGHSQVCEYLRTRRAGLDFFGACYLGELDYVVSRLKKNKRLASRPVVRKHRWNPYRAWPLQYSIAGRQMEILHALLRNMNRNETIDPVVAFDAVNTGQTRMVDALLAAGCIPDFTTQRAWLNPEFKKLARKHGFQFNAADFKKEKWPALVDACRGNHNAPDDIQRVIPILESDKDVNVRDYKEKTALHRAAQAGFPKITRLLVEHGADLNARDETGATPIFDAAFYGRVETLQLLVDLGADLETQDARGENVLFAALRGGHISSFTKLVGYPFLLNAENKKGQTVFDLAQKLSKTGVASIRKLLINLQD